MNDLNAALPIKTLQANGMEFAYFEAGEGPLVFLLHGFPDTALGWREVMPRIAAAGFRVVAPFLHDPTVIASGGTVRIANGCEVRDGFLEKVGLPTGMLPLLQIVEYLRAFLFGRLGWVPLNAVLIISGASALTDMKAMYGPGYMLLLWPLFQKLALTFLLTMVATYLSFGLAHRLVRAEQGRLPVDERQLRGMLGRLRGGAYLALAVALWTSWVGYRLSERARTIPMRSPLRSVTPALSMATSVPVPMAMPTSAAASAGASLTPSPAIATTRPWVL